jgi:hypothetical protein
MKWDAAISTGLGLVGLGFTLVGGPPLFLLARVAFLAAAVILIWGALRAPRGKLPAPFAVLVVLITVAGLGWTFAWISASETKLHADALPPAKPVIAALATSAPSSPSEPTLAPARSNSHTTRRAKANSFASHTVKPVGVTLNCGQSGGVNNGVYEANCEYR